MFAVTIAKDLTAFYQLYGQAEIPYLWWKYNSNKIRVLASHCQQNFWLPDCTDKTNLMSVKSLEATQGMSKNRNVQIKPKSAFDTNSNNRTSVFRLFFQPPLILKAVGIEVSRK